jgi:hypothetical protein
MLILIIKNCREYLIYYLYLGIFFVVFSFFCLFVYLKEKFLYVKNYVNKYYIIFLKYFKKIKKKIKKKIYKKIFLLKKYKTLFSAFSSWQDLKEAMINIYNMFCNSWNRLKRRFVEYQWDISLIYQDLSDNLYRLMYIYIDLFYIAAQMCVSYYVKSWCAYTCFILPRKISVQIISFILEHREIFLNIWNNPIVLGILIILSSYLMFFVVASKIILSFITSLVFLSHIHYTGEGFIVFYNFKDFETTLDDWMMVSPEHLEMIRCIIDWNWLNTQINFEKVNHFVIDESNIDETCYFDMFKLQSKVYNIMDDLTPGELKGFNEEDIIYNHFDSMGLNGFYFNQSNPQYFKNLNMFSSDNNDVDEAIKIMVRDSIYKTLNDNKDWMKIAYFSSSFSPVVSINMWYVFGSAAFLVIYQLSPQIQDYIINFPQEHPDLFIQILKGAFHYGVYYGVTWISSLF